MFSFKENYGVMGDPSTAMRDPIFYRWHAYTDDVFQEYKATIPGYNVQNVNIMYLFKIFLYYNRSSYTQLNFENVKVQSIEVSASGIPRNELATFWQQSDVNLSRGLDFLPRGNVFARFTHLQHAPFNYKIVVSTRMLI